MADRRLHHDQIAQTLRIAQESKRAVTALKAAERKKAALQKVVETGGMVAENAAAISSERRK